MNAAAPAGDPPAVTALFQDADAAHRRGDTAAADAALRRVLAVDAGHPRALNSLALRALAAGDACSAATMLAQAALRAAGVASIRVNQADAARALGDRSGELGFLDAALALDPYLVPALIRKAQALETLGSNAVPVWQAVLKTTPPGPERPPQLARILAHAAAAVEADALRQANRLAPALAAARAAHPPGATARVDHGIDALLGRGRIYWPEPTDLLVPGLPADAFHNPAHFPWMTTLEAAAPAVTAELQALLADDGQGFEPYVRYAPGAPVNQWGELNHSGRWSALFLWKDGVRRDDACARAPRTAAALDAIPRLDIPGKAPTAFFSLLAPGTRIPPHTGVTNCRAICHLALVVPPGCGFRVGVETREWAPGRAFAFDDSIEHEAWNDSDALRAVLIFDVWNPYLNAAERDLLRAYYPARSDAGSAGFD